MRLKNTQGTGIAVFHQGQSQNGQLWVSQFDGTNWQPDGQVPNVGLSESPSAVVYGGGIYVFHQGAYQDHRLWYSYYDSQSGTWAPDTQVPNLFMSYSPSAVVYGGRIYVFYQGYDNYNGGPTNILCYTYYDGTNWAPDTDIQNLLISGSPSAIVPATGISVFHQGASYVGINISPTPNGQLWYPYANDVPNWAPDTQVPNVGMSESPSAVVVGGGISVFHQGYAESGQLWYSYFDGANWQPDTQVPNVGMSESPSAVVVGGGISVFHQGYAESGQLWYSYFDGANWQPDTQVPNVGMSFSPSAVAW